MDGLNPRQKKFCKEYIIDFNATQAAIRAGYSKDTARQIASQNLTKLDIQTEINNEIDKRKHRVEVKQDRIIYELARIAFSDIKNYIKDGCIDYDAIKDEDSPIIQEFKDDSKTVNSDKKGYELVQNNKKLKLYDKIKALELLGRHLAMFTDKVTQDTKITNTQPIKIEFED
jgi:phage terminase small subunit